MDCNILHNLSGISQFFFFWKKLTPSTCFKCAIRRRKEKEDDQKERKEKQRGKQVGNTKYIFNEY